MIGMTFWTRLQKVTSTNDLRNDRPTRFLGPALDYAGRTEEVRNIFLALCVIALILVGLKTDLLCDSSINNPELECTP